MDELNQPKEVAFFDYETEFPGSPAYHVVSGPSVGDLAHFVRKVCEKGYTPTGGVAVEQKPDGTAYFHQAVVFAGRSEGSTND